jgi:hypothetical protein
MGHGKSELAKSGIILICSLIDSIHSFCMVTQPYPTMIANGRSIIEDGTGAKGGSAPKRDSYSPMPDRRAVLTGQDVNE